MSNENIKETNDKKIREYSKRILREILEKDYVEFPHFVSKIEKEDGEFSFILDIGIQFCGEAKIIYRPLKGIEALIKAYIFAKFPDKKEEFLRDGFSIDYITFDTELKIKGATIVLLKNFPWEFKEVVQIQPNLADLSLTLGKSKALSFKSTNQKGNYSKIIEETNELMLEFAGDRKSRFLLEFEARVGLLKPPEERFAILYEANHKKWEEAKSLYKQHKKSKDAVALVKAKFPNLDVDLIMRFESPDSYISMPSKIALFHTARELRMPEANASQKTLENILTKSRKALGSLSMDELENEEDSYAFFDFDSMQEVDLAKILIERFNKYNSED